MEKAKLGISVGLFAAGLYLIGLISFMALLLACGYVLLFESNAWLKRCAVKALCIVVGFALLSQVVSLGNSIISILNGLFFWVDAAIFYTWPSRIIGMVNTILHALEILFLVVLGLKALVQGDVKVAAIDKTIDKHM